MINPYSNLPTESFWRTGVATASPLMMSNIYKKKFELTTDIKIATAGSCFAQHIGKQLSRMGFTVLDVEPPPHALPSELHSKYGFGLYSGRYGNIYTVAQLLQLAQEVANSRTPEGIVWTRNGKFFDALRPAVEPEGLDSEDELLAHRKYHLSRVRQLFENMDVFIFTLGLTEAWVHRNSGTVFPTAPGVVAGYFHNSIYRFHNYNFNEIITSFNEFQNTVRLIRGEKKPPKYLLTVSPVPLAATATAGHVLLATTYSKSVLRAAAGFLAEQNIDVDYFPSFEIITNPAARGKFYNDNLRTVTLEGVETVMRSFFSEFLPGTEQRERISLPGLDIKEERPGNFDDAQCEEVLLEAFCK